MQIISHRYASNWDNRDRRQLYIDWGMR